MTATYLISAPRTEADHFPVRTDTSGVVAVPAIIVLGLWFVLQLFSSVGSVADTSGTESGGVAFMAHVGGFVAGFLMAFLFRGGGSNPRISA